MRILLVDDHAIVRTGLRKLLAMVSNAEILEAKTGRESLAIAKAQPLDMIILDLNLPELGGLELLSRLRQFGPAPILVLSMHSEPIYVTRALEAGAQGYMSKNASPDELLTAIRQVSGGGRYIEQEIAQALILQSAVPAASLAQLAPRDLEILRHLAAGRSLSEIAEALGLGYKTIANNCSLIKTKLGVTKTADLLRLALEAGVS
ncbi:MAG TPA: response regulator transcription factor [Phenylobacterium sp.]|uniref:response regulator transcription factor n=1 Tax=Phenylobacterium sp. TaxID=1871053 RepID=UPI002D542AA1|nr:response regulator transcription factor [Phenylobacterium sp.]HZZ68165.1 response regulator transcription factor [Phenylobacterium sp.]